MYKDVTHGNIMEKIKTKGRVQMCKKMGTQGYIIFLNVYVWINI